MAVEFKDYYKVLGVEKTATHDEIRKAFRKLARQYHPDVAKDKKRAEEKFKEINEAYEVLGDAEKRKKYDDLGSDWKSGGFRPPPPGSGGPGAYRTYTWHGGQPGGEENVEFGGTGFSDFFEQLFGGGFGRGQGGVNQHMGTERGADVEGVLMVTLEEAMRGGIRSITLKRHHAAPQTYKVKIPAGVRDGQRLRVPGQGEPGSGGGPPGDLYLRVRLASHPDFRIEGANLYYDLDLAPWEAALGTNVTIPTLGGGSVSIKVPSGTQNGQRFRIKGRGFPANGSETGDLYAVAHLQMPKEIGDKERTLWEELARESKFNPRG